MPVGKERATEKVGFNLTPAELQELDDAQATLGCQRSELIRECIALGLPIVMSIEAGDEPYVSKEYLDGAITSIRNDMQEIRDDFQEVVDRNFRSMWNQMPQNTGGD